MSVIRFGAVWLLTVSVLTLTVYAQTDPPPTESEEHILGESYNGPCFIDDYRTCQYALGEYQSQGGADDIVANCNECDPEAQEVILGQPVYYCLTAGKKEVVVARLINWVKSVESGKLLWGLEVPKTNCGIQMRCKPICKYDQTGINLYCGKEDEEPFLLPGRFAKGISCP